MFENLKFLSPNLNPKCIMIDYEWATLNGIKTEFPDTEVKGCFRLGILQINVMYRQFLTKILKTLNSIHTKTLKFIFVYI